MSPERDKQIINTGNISGENPEALDFKLFMDQQGVLTSKFTEIGGPYKKTLRMLVSEPDKILDKTGKLFDDTSLETQELENFIKEITQINELVELEKKTLLSLAELENQETKNENEKYHLKERQTELQMLNDKIIERTKKLEKYNKILEKLEEKI